MRPASLRLATRTGRLASQPATRQRGVTMSDQRTVPTRTTPGRRPGSRFTAGRRRKIIIGAGAVLAVLACLAGLALRLYLRYADVVRSTAEHGRVVVEAAPVGTLG